MEFVIADSTPGASDFSAEQCTDTYTRHAQHLRHLNTNRSQRIIIIVIRSSRVASDPVAILRCVAVAVVAVAEVEVTRALSVPDQNEPKNTNRQKVLSQDP